MRFRPLFVLVSLVILSLVSPSVIAREKASSEVKAWLNSPNASAKRLLVLLKTDVSAKDLPSLTRNQRTHAQIVRQLQSSYRKAASQLSKDLAGKGMALQNRVDLWLIGGMALDADTGLGRALLSSSKVASVSFPQTIKVLGPVERRAERAEDTADEYTYGLKKIAIPEVRAQFPEATGKGVRVGVIDTGIDASHPDLAGKLAPNGFRDFVNSKSEPYDDHGHGTHVSGTIAGGNASGTYIGVAPEVQLWSAKVFTAGGSGQQDTIVQAMQWMADPDEDPNTETDVPHVISNSWGGGGSASDQDAFYLAVEAWRKLQIFPSFAAGNSGPRPKTVSVPGVYDVSFAVGATDDADKVASFSSRGLGEMTLKGNLVILNKPDISAPGKKVYSCLPGGKYEAWSGTSMATPHVTGAVALLKQKYPNASVEEIAKRLTSSIDDLGPAGFDPDYGAGRMNVLKALTAPAGRRDLASRR
jgi:subtilisin family serine protease